MAKKTIAAPQTATQSIAQVVSPENLELTHEQRADVSSTGFSQCVRVLRQNWRQGTVACKGRSDVSFSNKKPWKQKGTGRARAGSARSPLWRKGGVTFGPQPRTRTLTASKELKKKVYNNLLWHYLDAQKVFSLNWQPEQGPKTAHAHKMLRDAGLASQKVTLFVSPHDVITHASFSNLPNVHMLLFDQANAYHLAYSDYWLFLQKDSDAFKEMVNSWI